MKIKEKILLGLIILLGFLLRLNGINWDNSCCQHPDERAIVMFALPLKFPDNIQEFLSPKSSLNPHFFAYGNLPLYILKGSSIIAAQINPQLANYDKINLVGRFISVIADVGTIIIIFLITRLLF